MRRLIVTVLVLGLLVAGVAGWFWQQYQGFLATPMNPTQQGITLMIPAGTSYGGMVQLLQERQLTGKRWPWRLAQQLQPVTIQAGEYRMEPDTLPREWLSQLASGQVLRHRFTLVEGWTFKQLREALARQPVLHSTSADWDEATLLASIDPQLAHPEGWFLPETYLFERGDSDVDLLQRAYQAMQQQLDAAWQQRDPELPLDNPYELLTLASIIERETGVADERARISGVFVRRLNRGMRLQTDPTVIYGLGDAYQGDITYQHLREDTPYNTYTRDGLPPTPIAMPGKAALQAAANPAEGTELYFVADGEGGHTFSNTLAEHNRAVRKLVDGQ